METDRGSFVDEMVAWMRAEDPGRNAVFCGPRGCGKTTAVRHALARAGRDAAWAARHVLDEPCSTRSASQAELSSRVAADGRVLVVVVSSRAARMRDLTESKRYLQLRWSWGPDARSLSPPWWRPDEAELRVCGWDVRSAFASARAFGPGLWLDARGALPAGAAHGVDDPPDDSPGAAIAGRLSAQDRVSDAAAAWRAGNPRAWDHARACLDDSEATCSAVPGSVFETALLPEILDACSALAAARDARRLAARGGGGGGESETTYGSPLHGVEGPCPSRRVDWVVAAAARVLVAADGVSRRTTPSSVSSEYHAYVPSREWSRSCSDAQRRASAERACQEAYGVGLDAESWSRLACLGVLVTWGCSDGKESRARFLRAFVEHATEDGGPGSTVVPRGGVGLLKRSMASLVVGISQHQSSVAAAASAAAPSRDEIVSALSRALSARAPAGRRKMKAAVKVERQPCQEG